jgi:hypothetical protein
MASKYHASILPNLSDVGDTITVDVDQMPPTDKNVTVRVIEVQGSGDPAQADALVLEVSGSVTGSALTLSGTPNIATSPTANPPPPQITLTIAGQSFVVGFPRADQENGLFELVVEIVSGGAKNFRSTTSAVVRFFRFLKNKRPVVTFLAEDPASGPFFQHAQAFWKAHADTLVFKPSLEEMVKFLNDNAASFGPYGEVNIVTHGNHFTTKTNTLKGETDRILSHEKIDDFFGSSPSDPTAAARITASSGFDSTSRVVFRACSVGNNPTFLQAVRDKVFGGQPSVLAPLFMQGYGIKGAGGETEFFVEQLEFLLPGADVVAIVPKQLPEPRGREQLLARRDRATRRPDGRRRLGHQLPRWRRARWGRRSGDGHHLGPHVATNRVARETKLPCDIADRHTLGQNLVTNDGDELHGNHPWAKSPRPLTVQPTVRGGSVSAGHERRIPRGGGSIPGGRRGSV